MDFDLFEMDDDDILSSLCIGQTDQIHQISNACPEFNCQGEDMLMSELTNDSFAKNFFIFESKFENPDEVNLTLYNFKKNFIYTNFKANYVFNQTRMHIQKLFVNTKTPTEADSLTFYQSRQQVTLLYNFINGSPNLEFKRIEEYLSSIRKLLDNIATKDFFKKIYLANSCKGNEIDSPAYHLLHGFLEWRLLDLSIIKKNCFDTRNNLLDDEPIEKFVLRYNRIIEDLIHLSICLYKKKNLPDLMFQSAFPCTCIKEAWLILQFLIENLNYSEYTFWKMFNEMVENIKKNPEKFDLTTEKIPEFVLWLLKGLVRLQGYKINGTYDGPSNTRVVENYNLLEPVVEQFINTNPSEEHIRIFLCNLMSILLEWWSAKVDIPMILWRYFHSKLNSQFFIAGSAPSSLAVSSSSGKGYLEKIKNLLASCTPDANLSSFTLFTLILGRTLEKLVISGQTFKITQTFSRIFTRFSQTKFLTLNEIGIHHLVEFFITLALTCDILREGPKLRDRLLSIQLDKITPKRQVILTKGHVALMILFSENMIDLSDYIKRFLEQLNIVNNDPAVCKILAEGLCDIFEKSENFENGEYLLIDSWITSYLNNSLPVEQERTLQVIHNIFEKIQLQLPSSSTSNTINLQISSNALMRANNFQNLLNNFYLHILPFVKQNFTQSYSIWLPKLAADFCINCQSPSNSLSNSGQSINAASSSSSASTSNINAIGSSATVDQGVFTRNFQFFIDAQCANKEAPLQFLLAILSSGKLNLIQPVTIIQIWLKSLVLLSSNNSDIEDLTKIVITLDDFRAICDLNESELLTAKEPLCVFVSAVGRNYKNCEDFQKKLFISDKFNQCLNGFEKWLPEKNEKQDVTMRFYSFMAIVIFNCAEIVYLRSKITCFFHIVLTRFILPTAVQIGKAPDTKIAQTVHKIWPVVVQGIGTLNFKSDQYLLKTLTDLIIKWVPHFRISQNPKIVARPFINCLSTENENLSIFIFEKLATVYLTMQRRQADPNSCLIITIFQEVVESSSNDIEKMKLFVKATNLTTLEHLMMVEKIVPSRALLLDMFKKICRSEAFKNSPEIRELITEHIKIITVKHLSFYAFFYFDLLNDIVHISFVLVEPIMSFIAEQIKVVEQKRGSGQDQRLRSCYHKLNGSITAAKNKRSTN